MDKLLNELSQSADKQTFNFIYPKNVDDREWARVMSKAFVLEEEGYIYISDKNNESLKVALLGSITVKGLQRLKIVEEETPFLDEIYKWADKQTFHFVYTKEQHGKEWADALKNAKKLHDDGYIHLIERSALILDVVLIGMITVKGLKKLSVVKKEDPLFCELYRIADKSDYRFMYSRDAKDKNWYAKVARAKELEEKKYIYITEKSDEAYDYVLMGFITYEGLKALQLI
ncbi:hypothetical protein HNQ80_003307 [Anaerosolibacter carboniphilus]|uniref:Uncharacterized protein n=1 Tax=Anaerosolibacter carboniphilus TaxID=1417629 RepID=A0A841KY14_9FIRM|nr:hypothetical protein [Anaerosolibacter carboniphilus]MBB6217188.1 hypothetical protein [Anaerosolibacter carboniphilus]